VKYSCQSGFSRSTTWLELNVTAVNALLTVTLLLGTASILATGAGKPETVALLVLAGIAVVLVGMALVRLSEHLRTDGILLS
jgi:hypothetical protein